MAAVVYHGLEQSMQGSKMPYTLPPVVDQYDDGGALLAAEIGGAELPPVFVEAVDMSKVASKLDADYALVADTSGGKAHRYPVLDAGNALASAFYFEKQAKYLPPDLRRTAAVGITHALREFGFAPTEGLTKQAAVDVLSFNTERDETRLEALFGVDDRWQTVKTEFDGLSPRGKRRLAMTLVKEAAAVPPDLQDYAAGSVGSDFSLSCDIRKLHAAPELHAYLDDMVKLAAGADPDELAEALAQFDLVAGITHLYGRRVPDPWVSVGGTSVEKTAATKQAAVEVDGRAYTGEQLAAFLSGHKGRVADVFGDDLAEQLVSRPVEVLSSLPHPHKRAIARMVDAG